MPAGVFAMIAALCVAVPLLFSGSGCRAQRDAGPAWIRGGWKNAGVGKSSPLAAHRYIRGSAREGAQETSKDAAHDPPRPSRNRESRDLRPDDAPANFPVLGWPSTGLINHNSPRVDIGIIPLRTIQFVFLRSAGNRGRAGAAGRGSRQTPAHTPGPHAAQSKTNPGSGTAIAADHPGL